MNYAEAVKLVSAFFEHREMPFSPKPSDIFFQLVTDETVLNFVYEEKERNLVCSALIYQFHSEPNPKVLEAVNEEGEKETVGRIEFDNDTKNLSLVKKYSEIVDETEFTAEINLLTNTAFYWSDEVLDKIASKVFHPEELEK